MPHSIAILGGGLAGLSAALALAQAGARIELFESRAKLGGRAGSFDDPKSGETLDFCQHVAMGCCTGMLEFCRAVGAMEFFRPLKEIVFVDESGHASRLRDSWWLPAPLHLAPAFARLGFLSFAERREVATGFGKLLRMSSSDIEEQAAANRTIGEWLGAVGQSPRTIERFWSTVLISALSETVDRAAFAPARKVFIDGFASHRDAWRVYVPQRPFDSLYEEHVAPTLAARGGAIHRRQRAQGLLVEGERVVGARFSGGERRFDAVIVAIPWRRAAELLNSHPTTAPTAAGWDAIESAPISSVHLWYDQPPLDGEAVALVGRTAQWLFQRETRSNDGRKMFHVQGVISASRTAVGRVHGELIDEVDADARAISSRGQSLRRIDARVVHQVDAVFSPTPQGERRRPFQTTRVPGLFLAGDWTQVGWPATMEGAVRSGRLAAIAVAQTLGLPAPAPIADLTRSWLMRWITH